MTLFSVFMDRTFDASATYAKGTFIYEIRLSKKLKLHTIYFFLSNDGELAIYADGEKVFPSEGTFDVVGVLVKIDLPKPLEFNYDQYLRVWFKNNSGTTMRTIFGLIGVYE